MHVDRALMPVAGSPVTVRGDLSATLFLSQPEDYEGGVLEIEAPTGKQTVKLPAGDMVLYPSGALHRVTPVTKGARIASFFWVESFVSDPGRRALLFEQLRTRAQPLRDEGPEQDRGHVVAGDPEG